jgi:hypothetical protein
LLSAARIGLNNENERVKTYQVEVATCFIISIGSDNSCGRLDKLGGARATRRRNLEEIDYEFLEKSVKVCKMRTKPITYNALEVRDATYGQP